MTETRHLFRNIGIGIALLLLGSAATTAQEESEVSDSTASSEEVLPTLWWTRNPLSYRLSTPRLLFRVEGNYSFDLQRGNVEGTSHAGSLKLWLRKGDGTLRLDGSADYQKLSLANNLSEVSTRRYLAGATYDYALTESIGPQVGILVEHNDAAFVETRQIGYLGLKVVPVQKDQFTLTLLPAFGYQYEEAILTEENRSFWSPYLEESIAWKALDRLSIEQIATLLFSLEDPSNWRGSLAGGVAVPVTDFLALTVHYELRYNNNPIPTDSALQRASGGVGAISKDDQTLRAGLRLEH